MRTVRLSERNHRTAVALGAEIGPYGRESETAACPLRVLHAQKRTPRKKANAMQLASPPCRKLRILIQGNV